MEGKIALEEHLSTPSNDSLWDSTGEAERNGPAYMADVERRLLDVEQRLDDMDRAGIGTAIVSLTSPGVQGVADEQLAVELARDTNDFIAKFYLAEHPERFAGFAAVALQNPRAAADEAARAVGDLGMKGILVNGYTTIRDKRIARYLDHEGTLVFWDRIATLGVPVYLHPREPLPGGGRRIYQGYESLIGSAWGFAHETATHAVRLMMSGLFDRHPDLTIILGHLGEGLPQLLPRLRHRLDMQREGSGLGAHQRPVDEYFRSNFYLTTSGHFHTPALRNAIDEIGADRVMFSVDYPYESMDDAADWFDKADLPGSVRNDIGYRNAARLFGMI
ncbi:amidohydrolase family protein [Nocardia sp. 2]|uniref:Amidohydrolase family protein n=1 Tax=Nocardia acididurans TaxID=2802282 RepID=A0ABS1MGY7_9NOCA|nr:amidohydrolase family protein [Nocardia acididurans]MBL1079936.1 amidohydrolase family protein [Nocardia acididurans]